MRAESRTPGIKLAPALMLLALSAILAACAATESSLPPKIALLAPFEGQYREIGYNALYALRLAFADAEPSNTQLLAVDDGGTVASAIARIKALNMDPAVEAIIALGPAATHPAVQMANDLPLVLIGNWGHDRADEDAIYAANPDLAQALQSGDFMALFQTVDLWSDLDAVTFASSGSLPNAAFRERFLDSAPYAPPPNLLATVTYDIARMALQALAAKEALAKTSIQGMYATISFKDGYWTNAPVKQYRYEGDQLVQVAA
jgi:hypothetical protein